MNANLSPVDISLPSITIDKGIPLPPPRAARGPFRYHYPLPEMEVGDSFGIELDASRIKRVNYEKTRARAEYPDRRYAARKLAAEYRLWRTA